MFKRIFIFFLISVSFLACGLKSEQKDEKRNWVGDINENMNTDDIDFKICQAENQIFQYFNFSQGPVYEGEKPKLVNAFKSNYEPIRGKNQIGFIRIRFVVNCKGEAGRFKMIQSDSNFQKTEFDNKITAQLLNITQDIKQWKILKRKGNPVDYYMYIIFKIEDGAILEILP